MAKMGQFEVPGATHHVVNEQIFTDRRAVGQCANAKGFRIDLPCVHWTAAKLQDLCPTAKRPQAQPVQAVVATTWSKARLDDS
jgi:hypothetical protein